MAESYIKRAHVESEFTPEQVAELRRCTHDPIHFIKKYVKVKHPTRGEVLFELYPYQEELIHALHNNRDVVVLAARQMGKTITISIYFLWLATFHFNQQLLIASKNNDHAIEIMDRVRYSYELLPYWLKAGCKYYNRHSIHFDNGSIIRSQPTTAKTGRGSSVTKLYLDELAFVNPRIQNDMWSSLAPTLSTGGSFIVSSTPNGDTELFANLWRGANSGANPFKPVFIPWWLHPERGPEFYPWKENPERGADWYERDMMGKLGDTKYRQEVLCEFVSSDALLIDSLKLVQLKFMPHIFENLGMKMWKPPQLLGGRGKTYLVGMDPATGTGRDFMVIQIFEFPSLEQIGELRSQTVNIPLMYEHLKELLKWLTRPDSYGYRAEVYWSFERNGVGEAIAAMVNTDDRPVDRATLVSPDIKGAKLGMFTSGKSKILACMDLKMMIERVSGGFKVNSEHLIFELKNYIASGGSYQAKVGATDDAVAATLIVTQLLKYLASFDQRAFETVTQRDAAPSIINPEMDGFGDEPVPFVII